MASFVVKGPPQSVEEFEENKSYTLHDPFLASTLEFIRRCLDQQSKALSKTVVFTYKKLPLPERKNFFLASYSRWKDVKRSNRARSNYGDPSDVESGQDIQWLLKNFRFHLKFYSEKLNMTVDELDDIISFLLDTMRNQLAHQHYLKDFIEDDPGNPWLRKYVTTKDCIDASLDLISAICESRFYKEIHEDISKINRNLERMKIILEEHRVFHETTRQRDHLSTDTDAVLNFLSSKELKEQLLVEKEKPQNINSRPLTHFFQMLVIPRLKK